MEFMRGDTYVDGYPVKSLDIPNLLIRENPPTRKAMASRRVRFVRLRKVQVRFQRGLA